MLDVIEVEFGTHKVRIIDRNKSERNAEAVVEMAVIRRGVENSFFTTCPAGKYSDGDTISE